MKKENQMTLAKVSPGQKVRLTGITAGDELKSRLAAMGMVPNTEITVVKNAHPGPFVISVKRSRIALGRGMAKKVLVENLKD
jgi:Fe2+ transport system protein FeoA